MIKNSESDYEKQTEIPFRDNLTGLFHHGFFLNVLNREINRSQRYGETISLALIDIDAVSVYNKHQGPLQADRALKEIAAIIRRCVRDVDLSRALWRGYLRRHPDESRCLVVR